MVFGHLELRGIDVWGAPQHLCSFYKGFKATRTSTQTNIISFQK